MDLHVFAFRYQPIRTIYLLCEVIVTLLIRLPYWIVKYLERRKRPRFAWSLTRCIQVEILRLSAIFGPIASRAGPIIHEPDHRDIPNKPGTKDVWIHPAPELVVGDVKNWVTTGNVELVNLPGYWYDKDGYDTPVEEIPQEGEKVLYMIHGGAFGGFSAHPEYTFGGVFRRLVSSHPSIRRGFAVEYRPTAGPSRAHPFPTALVDVLAGYAYLTDIAGFAPEDIIIYGDSAGGNLAIALVRYLLENRVEKNHLPNPPYALILVSPWVDLGDSHDYPDSSMQTCIESDYFPSYRSPIMLWIRKHYCSIVGFPEATNTNRYISPASIDHEMEHVSFKEFPRTFILYGDAEVLRDQVITLRERMTEDLGSVWVHYHVVRDGIHDVLSISFFQPEGSEAFKAISRWLGQIIPKGPSDVPGLLTASATGRLEN